MRVAEGFHTTFDSAPRVPCFPEAMKAVREGAHSISEDVALDMTASVPESGFTGGGR